VTDGSLEYAGSGKMWGGCWGRGTQIQNQYHDYFKQEKDTKISLNLLKDITRYWKVFK
jgi:hypothetical protein